MTPDEARQSITDLYAATRNALGGSWVIDAQTWLGCSSPGGQDGAAFNLGAVRLDQPLSGEPREIVTRIQNLWSSRGIPAKVFFDRHISLYTLSYPRFGTGADADGYLVQFGASAGFADFTGTSPCVPGDPLELDFSEVGRAVE